MSEPEEPFRLELLGVEREPTGAGVEALRLQTNAGTIEARLHVPAGGAGPHDAAIVWVGGVGGGVDGPAGGLYPRLASILAPEGIASLRLDYRHPKDLTACVLDTLVGSAYLDGLDYHRIALVGHSFGGAVVITAGAFAGEVVGVAALSSQTMGTEMAPDLGPRPLLLLHGEADTVLPPSCSRQIYRRAAEPKKVILYPGCGHGLDECRAQVDRDLLAWLRNLFGIGQGSSGQL